MSKRKMRSQEAFRYIILSSLVHAKTYAQEANRKRLLPGDMVTLKGSSYTQDFDLVGGERKTIKHLYVTDIEVIKWAKRESITVTTVYERKRGK